MKTAKEMLDKVRWDENENPEDYTIAYRDREELAEITYADIKRIEDEFMIVGVGGRETSVPLHRIRQIRKRGEIVWRR